MEGPRFTADGVARYRPYVKERGKKVRGPWGTAADGKAWLAHATLTRHAGGTVAPAKGETIRESSERFLDGIRSGAILSNKRRPYESKTVRGYEQAFEAWINPELGHIPVAALRRDQVQRWVDWLHSQRSGATVRNTWAALAALYRWLLPRNHELADPTDGIERPAPARIRERYAEPEEARELLAALPLRLAVPYSLAFYAGLRHAEIRALPVDMIDLDEGFIRVRYALDPHEGWKGPKSDAGVRDVPLFAPLRPYLEAQLEVAGPCLAPSTDGTPGTPLLPSRRSPWGVLGLGTPFTQACRDAWAERGLKPIGLHEARHSFATALIRAGYDVRTVQEWIGHADPATTLRIYAKRRGRQAGLTEKMDAYLA
jgi:integrase